MFKNIRFHIEDHFFRNVFIQIAEAFHWAGSPDHFRSDAPAKPHCYDQDIQEEALAWFNKHLKAGKE